MAERADNPLGTQGFSFVEFAARESDGLGPLFERLGFAPVARHRKADLTLYRQGEIGFLLNTQGRGQAAAFRDAHGPGVSGISFCVEDGARAFVAARRRGAAQCESDVLPSLPAIASVGDTRLFFIDAAAEAAMAEQFVALPGAAAAAAGLNSIDHIAFNLHRGESAKWTGFYEDVLGFHQIRYFHIAGKHTGFHLRAMASPCGKIRIPLNESRDDSSQIQEFIGAFKGEGVQHIGLAVDDIHASVEALRRRGLGFQANAADYYAALPARVTGHNEDLARLRANGILLDGDAESGLLMQIFTTNAVGPMFFELIQRKGNQGFGEGNVTALFEALEAEQMRRGALRDG